MRFIHEPLTWFFLLALAPLLIHLINMMRHRRVKWAAMDFLLQSYKKHRKWVWLKQLLLMASRMAAIAVIVAMLAQLVTLDQFSALFGGKATHHYILLDDSFSMSDRGEGQPAFERAQQVVGRIAARARAQDSRQKITLLRFSRAASAIAAEGHSDGPAAAQGASGDGPPTADVADLLAVTVDGEIDVLVEERRRQMEVTELAVSPAPALELLEQLFDDGADENRIVYVVSDFRAADWANPSEIAGRLRSLRQQGAEVHLVGAIRTRSNNLAITSIEPADGTRAAGVPLFVNVTVKNFGVAPARRVQVSLRTRYFDPAAADGANPGDVKPDTEDLPAMLFDEIKPGDAATQRIQVYFPKAGRHVVEASLPPDAVAADNTRWCVVDFPEGEPVLVIDGHDQQRNAYFLNSAFEPGQRAYTGVRPVVQPPAFLRDTAPETLATYRSVYLLDPPLLDQRAVSNLEAYVQSGGGLAMFVGPQTNLTAFNERLYREGAGLAPLPLAAEATMTIDALENTPDIEVEDHPIFRVFLGERNPLIRLVAIDRYLRPPAGWAPDPNSTVEVIARLRGGSPLCVERKFGEGVVLIYLTTVAPDWNNWAHDPSFVVAMLKTQSYLGASRRLDPTHLVGAPLTMQLDAERYRPEVTFLAPGAGDTRLAIDRRATRPQGDSPLLRTALGDGLRAGATTGESDRAGVYEAWTRTVAGDADIRRFAVNVDTQESDLTLVEPSEITARLPGVRPHFAYWEGYESDPVEQAGFNWSQVLLGLLIVLLLGEQVLAYSASYHPARGALRT